MQTTIKSEVDYKDPKTYCKPYSVAKEEYDRLKLELPVKLCKVRGQELYTVSLMSKWIIENKLKHLKIVM